MSQTTQALTARGQARALPESKSEMQRMLWQRLQEDWEKLASDPTFVGAEVFSRCPTPLTREAVFQVATENDSRQVLLSLRSCFSGRDGPAKAFRLERNSPLFDNFMLIALIAAERLIRIEADKAVEIPRPPHEPVWHDDPLIACLLAAAIFRFGLRFDSANDLPANVLHPEPPLAEFGIAGESGTQLIRKELLAKSNLIDVGFDFPLGEWDEVPDELLKDLVARAAEKLQCSLVVSAKANEPWSSSERRKRLQDDLQKVGVKAFFRPDESKRLPQSIRDLLIYLKLFLGPFFQAPIESRREDTTMPNDDGKPPASVTNNNFFAPVNNLAQANAPSSQAVAQGVINNGPQLTDLLSMLDAVQRAINACTEAPAGSAQRLKMEGDLSEIREVLKTEDRSKPNAKLVKRCLDGLKDAAGAVKNGSTIVETLTPVWEGLKNSWPDFAALVTGSGQAGT